MAAPIRVYRGAETGDCKIMQCASGDDVVVQVAFGDEICGFVKRFVSASDETTILHQFNPDQDISHPAPDVKAVHLVVGSLAAGL